MHIDSYFSLSNSNVNNAEFVVLGVPYDSTQSFITGSRFLPNAVREASWNLESYSILFDCDLAEINICDAGNINVDGNFVDVTSRVESFYKKIGNSIPIAIGGEHTISYACSKNFKNAYVVFDAHFDLRDTFDGNKFNHACTIRRIYEKIGDVVLIGARSGTKEERQFAEKNIKVFYACDILEKGVDWVIEDLNYDSIYLSLDMDVFDPAFASVSTPEPFGLFPAHFLQFLKKFEGKIVGFDVVEAIPDGNKKTQTFAAKLIFEFIARCKV